MGEDCTVDGDCSILEDTATPDPPFGGGVPTACCPCVGTCGCRDVGTTATVSFAGVLNAIPCTKCGDRFVRGGTLIFGTYTLTKGGGCSFSGTITGDLFEVADAVGEDCPPDEDFSPGESSATIELSFDPITGHWGLTVFAEDFQFFLGDVDQGDCTGPLMIDNEYTDYDPCSLTTFAMMKDGTATVVFAPCVP